MENTEKKTDNAQWKMKNEKFRNGKMWTIEWTNKHG